MLALDTNTLRKEYVDLCGKLEYGAAAGFERWNIFVDVAHCRAELVQCQVPHSQLALEGECSSDFAVRAGQLARAVVRHFGDRRLDRLLSHGALAQGGLAHAFDAVIETLRRQRWRDSYERVQGTGFRTCQEDVLLQELKAIGEAHDELGRIGEFIDWVRLARARDNAVASLIRLTGTGFREDGVKARFVASVGAGLAQFEELIARKSCAHVVASDVESRPVGVEAETSIEFVRSEADAFVDEMSADSVGLFIVKDVLHHIPDPEGFMQTCREKLEPGGRMIVVEPVFGESMHAELRALQELDATPYKTNFRPATGWEQGFRSEGFDIVGELPLSPGVLDNNDSFLRHAWTLRKC